MVSDLPAGVIEGTRVGIVLDGFSAPLSAVVLAVRNDKLHGRFELSPELGQDWSQQFARLAGNLEPLMANAA